MSTLAQRNARIVTELQTMAAFWETVAKELSDDASAAPTPPPPAAPKRRPHKPKA
jgi:hypothetical protein